jgi:hypothetical protein
MTREESIALYDRKRGVDPVYLDAGHRKRLSVAEIDALERALERALEVRLPQTFRTYLASFGAGDFGSEAVYGRSAGPGRDLVAENRQPWSPPGFIAVTDSGCGTREHLAPAA